MMEEELDILLVTPVYPPPPGGIQTLLRNLEKGLGRLDHNPIVLHVDPENHRDYNFRDFVPTPVTFSALKSRVYYLYPYLNAVYRKTLTMIEKHEPDIVHAIHIRGWPGLAAAQEHNIPTVVSTHAAELSEKYTATQAFHWANAVHAVSNYTSDIIERDFDTKITDVIPPSIEVDHYVPENCCQGISKEGNVFTISRFVDRKNISVLVDAWKLISDDIRNKRNLVLAGEGPLYDLIREKTTTENDIQLLGWIDEEEKRNHLQESDLFVLPASGSGYDVEGFGIVYIESQAAGTPVIGSNRGGVPEAVGDGGLILDDENDPEELAEKIEYMLTNTKVHDRYLGAACSRVQDYDIETISKKYVNLYMGLTESVY